MPVNAIVALMSAIPTTQILVSVIRLTRSLRIGPTTFRAMTLAGASRPLSTLEVTAAVRVSTKMTD